MGQKSKNAGNKKKNIYYNSTPSKEYGNMNDEKKKVNEEFLDWTLNYIIKLGGIWIYYDYQQPYNIILDNGVRKFSSDIKGLEILQGIVSQKYIDNKFVLK